MILSFGRVEQAVQHDREFDDAEVRGQVSAAADALHRVDEESADLTGELDQLFMGQAAKIGGRVNPVEQSGQVELLQRISGS